MNNLMKDTLEKIAIKEKIGNTGSLLMRSDPNFALAVQEAETHWLSKANTILAEILDEVRKRVTSPDTSMNELVKALDAISNKWNIAMGKPTSFGISANVKVDRTIKDEDLDNRIKELENYMLTTPPHHQIPQGESDGIPPLNSSEHLGELFIEGEWK
jgi:hypothetical protein